ncbi:MAG: ORF6N domain-containing protein [Clostridiales bacterium]|nr:ORF6N domain-containing protein [Clostridiales bacterium]
MTKNPLVTKESLNIPVVFNGQTVITTEMLASVYGTDTNNIQVNFIRNKDKFEEGKHYILLQGAELKEFKNQPTNSKVVKKNTSQLYLWTERGASRHCKILDTDKAWEQFDYLEEAYFKVKELSPVYIQDLITDVKAGFEILKSEIREEVAEMVRQGKENHRLSHKTKLDLNHIIHSYAVCEGDAEVLKQMTLAHFNASRWQDIAYDQKNEVIKFIRSTAKDMEMFVQESYLD